jgi:hypothetical protein
MSAPPGYNPDVSVFSGGTETITKVMGGGGSMPNGYNAGATMFHGGEDIPIQKVVGGGEAGEGGEAEAEAEAEAEQEGGAVGISPVVKIMGSSETKPTATTNTHGSIRTKSPTSKLRPNLSVQPSTPLQPKQKQKQKAPSVSTLTPAPMHPVQVEAYTPVITQEEMTEIQEYVQNVEASVYTGETKVKLLEMIKSYTNYMMKKWKRYDSSDKEQPVSIPTYEICEPLAAGQHSKIPASTFVEVLPSSVKRIAVVPPIKGNVTQFLHVLEFLYESELFRDDKLEEGNAVVFMGPLFGKEKQGSLLYLFLRFFELNLGSVYVIREEGDTMWETGCALYEKLSMQPQYPLLNFLSTSHLICQTKVGNYEGIIFSHSQQLYESKNANFPSIKTMLLKQKRAFAINSAALEDMSFQKYFMVVANGLTNLVKTQGACENLIAVLGEKDLKSTLQVASGETMFLFRLGEEGQQPILCRTRDGRRLDLSPLAGEFRGAEDNPRFYSHAPLFEHEIDGVERVFRIPLDGNGVKTNWIEGLYSNQEAAFLNYLNLTPKVCAEIFGSSIWKEKVAEFLGSVVVSKCFEDTSVLAKASCESTRHFLNKVFTHEFMKGKDMPLPLAKEKKAPESAAWPSEITPLESVNLTGGTDPTVEEGEYYLDLIVINRTTLKKLFGRLYVNKPKLNSAGFKPAEAFATLLQELHEKYSGFAFIS